MHPPKARSGDFRDLVQSVAGVLRDPAHRPTARPSPRRRRASRRPTAAASSFGGRATSAPSPGALEFQIAEQRIRPRRRAHDADRGLVVGIAPSTVTMADLAPNSDHRRHVREADQRRTSRRPHSAPALADGAMAPESDPIYADPPRTRPRFELRRRGRRNNARASRPTSDPAAKTGRGSGASPKGSAGPRASRNGPLDPSPLARGVLPGHGTLPLLHPKTLVTAGRVQESVIRNNPDDPETGRVQRCRHPRLYARAHGRRRPMGLERRPRRGPWPQRQPAPRQPRRARIQAINALPTKAEQDAAYAALEAEHATAA